MTRLTQQAKYFLLCALFALSLLSCKTEISGQYQYTLPEQTSDGLSVADIELTTLDTTVLFKALHRIKRGKYPEIHSLLVYKNDNLVLEEYFSGHDYDWEQPNFWGLVVDWDKDLLHNIMSDTKSVTSILIGLAIDHGFIENEQESVFNYLPDYTQFKKDGREDIRIVDLLTMTSGLEGNEWTSSYKDLENPIIKLWLVEDPIRAILDRPMVAKPGTHFSYWGGNNILLGEILKNATGMEVEDFAQKYLFEPLLIQDYNWPKVNDGPQDAAGGLELRPRDMMKIGILFLDQGKWEGQQILSAEWVKKSSVPYGQLTGIRVPGSKWSHGYAYSWWTKSYDELDMDIFLASGWGGQNIMVLPASKMVVVFTGGNYTKAPAPKKIMDKYIVPAIR